ncbi:MAG: hypothetical protein IKX88_01810 [Thermoguttaceae bacterium]|nr:hypothetical protein [Thermoguttaceae bacterium]
MRMGRNLFDLGGARFFSNKDEAFSVLPTDQCIKLLYFIDLVLFETMRGKIAGFRGVKTKIPESLELDEETGRLCVERIISVLKGRFKDWSPLGRCAIDAGLKLLPIPLTRGQVGKLNLQGAPTRLAEAGEGVSRFYVDWFNESGRDGVDMRASFVGPRGNVYLDGTPGRSPRTFARFSEKVRGRRGYNVEFVDVDMPKARKRFEYLVVDLARRGANSFSAMKTSFGFESRDRLDSNPDWAPRLTVDARDVATKRDVPVIGVVDLKKRLRYTCDADVGELSPFLGNYEALQATIKRLTQPPTFSMYDLLTWHVEARGELVPWNDFYQADRCFCLEDFYRTDEAWNWIEEDD